MSTWFVVAFFSLLAALTFKRYLPIALLVGYLLLSVLTFATYAMDKAAAQKGEWRTNESTLQLFALLGGWPGGLLAQEWLRHKSSKSNFKAVFWIAVVCNCAVLGWLLTKDGTALMRRFF
jgi:uncharacterized membrane protein YsdA (DUF1294 family)